MTLDQQKELLSKITKLLTEAEDKYGFDNEIGAIINFGENYWEWSGQSDTNWYSSKNFAEGRGPFQLIDEGYKIEKVKVD